MAKRGLIQKIGSLLGAAKKRDKDLFDLWNEQCIALGYKNSDRIMELMAWDLETGGINLKVAAATKKKMEIGEKEGEIDHLQEMARLAKQAIVENVKQQQEYAQQLNEIMNTYATQMQQMQLSMQQMQQMIMELQQQQKELEMEKTKVELEKREIAAMKKEKKK